MTDDSVPLTIIDLADHLKLDKSTVSRALNNKPGVASSTRERVLQAARELGYTPNIHGQQLRGWTAKNLGIILPIVATGPLPMSQRFYGPLVLLAFSTATRQGYDVLVISTDQHQDANLADVLVRKGVSCVLLLGPQSEKALDDLRDASIPVLQLDTYSANHPTLGFVTSENHQATYRATQHLIELGHQKLALIGDPQGISPFRERFEGFKAALDEAGLEEVVTAAPRHLPPWEYSRALLTCSTRPTAIVATSDIKAVHVLEVTQDLGIKVPSELSVIGFDDVDRSLAENLSLATIRIDQDTMVDTAVNTLINGTHNGEPTQIRIPTQLILRDSVAAPETA